MSIQIRNFCIISHIDHGKSTLSDCLLEITETVEARKMKEQFLDMMDLEREKGITIKMQPVRMIHRTKDTEYILNLIDTPGHVDFSYEVSRSLAAVEGALLIVDASQGVQAQTLANLHLAQEQGLIIIPIINKIDLPHADVEQTEKEISQLLQIKPEEIIKISARKKQNIDQVLNAIIEKVPGPKETQKKSLRALIFDSSYDSYKGVIAYVRIMEGNIRQGQKIKMLAADSQSEVLEIGFFRPQMQKAEILQAGEIGYLATGLKQADLCRVGDTVFLAEDKQVPALPGYQEPKPMVFAGFYPYDAADYELLKESLERLKLSDASLVYELEMCEGLGRGFRCGFLGMLHLEIVLERIKREYQIETVVTSPSVKYRVVLKKDEKYLNISSAADLPDLGLIKEIQEPWMNLEVITPSSYLGGIMNLLENSRANYQATEFLTEERVLLKYQAPLNEIVVDFYDQLKNISAGYASVSYQPAGYYSGDLVKLEILVAQEKVSAFSRIVHRSKVEVEARAMVKKLKDLIPKQLFAVPIQAAADNRIIARETISAMRKDVTGYLYGGDYTRKRKLLEKQKKGKKKMKALGKVNIPQEVFFKALKNK